MSVVSTSTAATVEIQDAPPGSQAPYSQATLQLSDADNVPSRSKNMPESYEHPDPSVARSASGSQDTVVVPETMSDVASIIHCTLRKEIRALRAHDASRELDMQALKSTIADLRASHEALDIRLRQYSTSPLTCTAQSHTLVSPHTTPSMPSSLVTISSRSPSETASAEGQLSLHVSRVDHPA